MAGDRELLSYLEAFKTARVLCIGDVMLDHYVYGDVDRVSPEAPVPVLAIRREAKSLGGAGNVLRNLCSLGASLALPRRGQPARAAARAAELQPRPVR